MTGHEIIRVLRLYHNNCFSLIIEGSIAIFISRIRKELLYFTTQVMKLVMENNTSFIICRVSNLYNLWHKYPLLMIKLQNILQVIV